MQKILVAGLLAACPALAVAQDLKWKCPVSNEWRLETSSGKLIAAAPAESERDAYFAFDMSKQTLAAMDRSGSAIKGVAYRLVARSKSEMEWTFVDQTGSPDMSLRDALTRGTAFMHVITDGRSMAFRAWNGTRIASGGCVPHRG